MKKKKATLTLRKLEEFYQETKVFDKSDDWVIKSWKLPFLWILWFFIGYWTESEGLKMYWLDFRYKRYLLKSTELK